MQSQEHARMSPQITFLSFTSFYVVTRPDSSISLFLCWACKHKKKEERKVQRTYTLSPQAHQLLFFVFYLLWAWVTACAPRISSLSLWALPAISRRLELHSWPACFAHAHKVFFLFFIVMSTTSSSFLIILCGGGQWQKKKKKEKENPSLGCMHTILTCAHPKTGKGERSVFDTLTFHSPLVGTYI